MKSPVSLAYVIAVALLAVSAAVLSYMAPQPALNLASLLLGIYALHLVSLRIVLRQFAGAAPVTRARRTRRSRTTEAQEDIRRVKEELDLERRELDNQKAELQERIVAAEQQWELLRQMIRERVEGGATVPETVEASSPDAWTARSPLASGPGKGPAETPRIHGRW
jgi:hypothetical protein